MLLGLVIVLTVLFTVLFFKERRTLFIGALFVLWFAAAILYLLAALEVKHERLSLIIAVIIAIPLVLLLPFYLFSFIILLITSGIRLIKREGKKVQNFLSISLGLFLIVWVIISPGLIDKQTGNPLFMELYAIITFGVYYFFFLMVLFAFSAALNRIPIPFRKYDYVIVLGSGLIEGAVPPLLASRIDKGMEVLERCSAGGRQAKIVFTGGQGADEPMPEGAAMAAYAMEKGLEKERIIVEDQSASTYENLLFAKRLIEADAREKGKGKQDRILIVTNNFHVFRALLWSRKVKMKSDGAGSKTKFYYWLNALIREFIGVLYMQRKFHLSVMAAAVFFITAMVALLFSQ